MKKIRISNYLNKDYRDFALYTISSRGIPNVNDCLTPGQRIILLYAPKTFHKTLSLVGDVMKSGHYRHGDNSISNTIMKMARAFQSSESILEGDGFFGSVTNHNSAAARYTSIKINPKVTKILDDYKHLNEKNVEGSIDILTTKVPIGLLGISLGIAVGFATKILPRNLDEMVKYLNGKKANLNPFFQDWDGEVAKFDNKGGIDL